MNQAHLNVTVSNLILDKIKQIGCNDIGIAPGYRNSPINYVAHKMTGFNTFMHYDERSLAFYALGKAKSVHRPVAITCTSGTALANFYPAILEAYYSYVPLIILTADRPPRLRGSGANQTMDQENFFGKNVTHFHQIYCCNEDHLKGIEDNLDDLLQNKINRPLHLNICFEEPLLPEVTKSFKSQNYPLKNRTIIKNNCNKVFFDQLTQQKNLIVAIGPEYLNTEQQEFLLKYLVANQLPLLCEPINPIYFNEKFKPYIIEHFDYFITKILQDNKNLSLLRIGHPLISKKYLELEQQANDFFIIDHEGEKRSPTLCHANYAETINCFEQLAAVKHNEQNLLVELKVYSKAYAKKIEVQLTSHDILSETKIHHYISTKLKDKTKLVIANSMPVRDFCKNAKANNQNYQVATNRGLSGIDGIIATTFGFAEDNENPTFCVIGDLSFYYDISSLSFAASANNVTFLVLNNSGGDIFRYVGTKDYPEEWYVLPQSIDLQSVAKSFSCNYFSVKNLAELEQAIDTPSQQTKIIEAFINLDQNKKDRSLK